MDLHYDWIAVGSGASGLASALWAAHRGLKAIVIEKAPVVGGATAYSYGGLWAPNNALQRAAGLHDSNEQGLEYLRFLSGGFAEEEKMRLYATEAAVTIEAFGRLGVPFRIIEGLPDHYFPGAPGSLGLGRTLEVVPLPKNALPDGAPALLESPYMPGGVSWSDAIKWGGLGNRYSWARENLECAASLYAAGQGLVAWLLLKCLEKGVTILTQSPATRLLLQDGGIAGVEVKMGDSAQRLQGDWGVFLGTGGYESNPEFVRAYQSFPNSAPHHPPTQTGDGLLMAGELGAFIRNIPTSLSSMVGYWIPRFEGEPEFHSAGIQELAYPHSIVVNSEGRRFGNEAFFQEFVVKLREFDVVKKHRYANIPFFLLFDSQFRERYPFANIAPGTPLPDWIKRAESLADLARQLDIDAGQLEQTVARFNDNARAGLDPEFGRGQSLWIRKVGDTKHPINPNLGPLEKAPFYGVELTPTESSSAGLYTDIHGRVMHLRGHAIPHLYAGGTVRVRTEYGAGYQAGLTLLGGMTFGRMAVEHVLISDKKRS
jgi:3-oxosteroid 1-dehydrogenase